jgi:hypothetical protein
LGLPPRRTAQDIVGEIRHVVSAVVDFAKGLFRTEALTIGGRINALGMVAAFALVALLTFGGVVTSLVRLFRPNAAGDASVMAAFYTFIGLIIVCALLSEYLMRIRNREIGGGAIVDRPAPRELPSPKALGLLDKLGKPVQRQPQPIPNRRERRRQDRERRRRR